MFIRTHSACRVAAPPHSFRPQPPDKRAAWSGPEVTRVSQTAGLAQCYSWAPMHLCPLFKVFLFQEFLQVGYLHAVDVDALLLLARCIGND